MSDLHVRTSCCDTDRAYRPQSSQEEGRRCPWGRFGLGSSRCNRSALSSLPTSESFLFSDADAIGGRANDHLLQVRTMCPPVEGKLMHCRDSDVSFCTPRARHAMLMAMVWLLLAPALGFAAADVRGSDAVANISTAAPFSIVLFTCVWKRMILTNFVLNYYAEMRKVLRTKHNINLLLFITGSDNVTTSALAAKYNAQFAVHPNTPLGAKHNLGLVSLRRQYEQSPDHARPDAVVVIGSDDLLSAKFFEILKHLMLRQTNRIHAVGISDIFFYDLKSQRLMYSQGYREYVTDIAGTMGCGRALSWAMMDALDWRLWDSDRNRGLDQSAIRRILSVVPQVQEISTAIPGRHHDVFAIDVKTDGYDHGANIWRFQEVVNAVGKRGRLHQFEEENAQTAFDKAFGKGFFEESLQSLRNRMEIGK